MKQQGFTLVELMIVIVIIGIAAMIAVPAFNNSMDKSRRTDGHTALLDLQLEMEKYRGNCALYPDDIQSGGVCADREIDVSETSDEGWYDLTIVSATGNAYQIKATAKNDGPQKNDSGCLNMTITVNGSNPKGLKAPADCW